MAAGALGAVLCCALAGTAVADSPAEQLQSIERSIETNSARQAELDRRADRLKNEAAALRQRAVAVAARARQHEATLTALEARLDELAASEDAVLASFDQRRRQLALLIAALERIARHPPIALIALPASPTDTVRSALLLRSTVPEVETRAKALRNDLDALVELREGMGTARAKLAAEQRALDEERRTLAALSDEKARLVGETEAERRSARARAEKLAAEAENLRDLIAKLSESRNREAAERSPAATPEPPPNVVAALPPDTGRLSLPAVSLPAAGPVVQRFGEAGPFGQPARGVSIRTREAAAVVAPRAGTVVFAGPFQGLGQLLIIEHGGEYHLLLAGLSRIDAAVGDQVLAGEPVGSMDASQDAKPTLYLELRRKGRPVDPMPWLAAGRTRVNG